jgi:hypothetical protein
MNNFFINATATNSVEMETIQQGSAGDCVKFARNVVLGYAAGNDMETTPDGPEYNYLMGLYKQLYADCYYGSL